MSNTQPDGGIASAPPLDANFCFPLPAELKGARVRLEPFDPSRHLDAMFSATQAHPELYTYLPFGPFATSEELRAFVHLRMQTNPNAVLFAIVDATAVPPKAVGTVGLDKTDRANLSAEVVIVLMFPEFQGKGYMAAAVRVLLRWCFSVPADGGLGLRRIQWLAHTKNNKSIQLAQHLGFELEGVMRWHRVLAPEKLGNGKHARAGELTVGRDTALLAICWDDWGEQVREVEAKEAGGLLPQKNIR